MAKDCSFDIVSKADINEVKTAIDQVEREILQRFDFKGGKAEISFEVAENRITLHADDDFKLRNMVDILQTKMVKREVSLKFLEYGKVEPAAGATVKQQITLKQGISKDNARKIIDTIKALKLKVQSSIQEDQVRVAGKERDDMQKVIAHLKTIDFGIELDFQNYR